MTVWGGEKSLGYAKFELLWVIWVELFSGQLDMWGEAEALLETEVLESPGWVGTQGTGWRRSGEECGKKRSQDSSGEHQGLERTICILDVGDWLEESRKHARSCESLPAHEHSDIHIHRSRLQSMLSPAAHITHTPLHSQRKAHTAALSGSSLHGPTPSRPWG